MLVKSLQEHATGREQEMLCHITPSKTSKVTAGAAPSSGELHLEHDTCPRFPTINFGRFCLPKVQPTLRRKPSLKINNRTQNVSLAATLLPTTRLLRTDLNYPQNKKSTEQYPNTATNCTLHIKPNNSTTAGLHTNDSSRKSHKKHGEVNRGPAHPP